jgi:hypothetical protein
MKSLRARNFFWWSTLLVAIAQVTACGATDQQSDPPAFLADGHVATISYCYPDRATVYAKKEGENPARRTISDSKSPAIISDGTQAGALVKVTLTPQHVKIEFCRGKDKDNAWAAANFHGVEIEDLDSARVGAVVIDKDNSILPQGFDASRVTTEGNRLYVNFQHLSPWNGQIVELRVGSVPSPPDAEYRNVIGYRLDAHADLDEASIIVRLQDDAHADFASTGPMPLSRAEALVRFLDRFKDNRQFSRELDTFRFGDLPVQNEKPK